MGWLQKLFTGSVEDVVEKTGEAIDRLVTSDEERLQAKNELQKILNEAKSKAGELEAQANTELTKRLQIDMTSDSWLSKNIRPLSLAFLTVTVTGLAYWTTFKLDPAQMPILSMWVELFSTLLNTAFGFYFGSRGLQHITKIIGKHFGKSHDG